MGFIDVIKERAKESVKTIVLPETEDSRTLEAAAQDPERRNRKDHAHRQRGSR